MKCRGCGNELAMFERPSFDSSELWPIRRSNESWDAPYRISAADFRVQEDALREALARLDLRESTPAADDGLDPIALERQADGTLGLATGENT